MATHPLVLFARVGWMHYYHNWMPNDEPVGGGSFNEGDTGSEVANFLPWHGKVYGFFRTKVGSRLDFKRIDPKGDNDRAELSGVLLIFVAPAPQRGQVVVGWYRNATVLAEPRRRSPHPEGGRRWHNAIAKDSDAVLLPVSKRTLTIERGLGGIGQSNVCYPLKSPKDGGGSKLTRNMKKAIELAEQYAGPNLMWDHSLDEAHETVGRLDAIAAAARGQGFAQTSEQRRAIEKLSMRRAMGYFAREFPQVEDVCNKGRSYDIHCQKGKTELLVEVKGTTGDGSSVFLTKNEYDLAKKGNSALYVLHSIRVNGTRATGGKERVLSGWDVSKGTATPVVYRYKLPD